MNYHDIMHNVIALLIIQVCQGFIVKYLKYQRPSVSIRLNGLTINYTLSYSSFVELCDTFRGYSESTLLLVINIKMSRFKRAWS
jgi:hypothetical protein